MKKWTSLLLALAVALPLAEGVLTMMAELLG